MEKYPKLTRSKLNNEGDTDKITEISKPITNTNEIPIKYLGIRTLNIIEKINPTANITDQG